MSWPPTGRTHGACFQEHAFDDWRASIRPAQDRNQTFRAAKMATTGESDLDIFGYYREGSGWRCNFSPCAKATLSGGANFWKICRQRIQPGSF